MNTEDLKLYLNKEYQGSKSFLENVILPIFKDGFDDDDAKELLKPKSEYLKMADNVGVRSIKFLGRIYLGEPLQIYDITVADRVKMERNRVGIQSIIRRMMDQYSNAFMIFHYEETTRWDWRFTFCHKSADKEESTDSKRYTFLLGPNQSCRTAAANFVKLYEKRGNIEIDDIERAFSVEALSDEFFEKYKGIYADIIQYVTGKRIVKVGEKWVEKVIHAPNEFIMHQFAHFDNPEKTVRDYVKKLMGRLVFLQFLQKKGWLGVAQDKAWGEGELNFTQLLFEKCEDKNNFIDNVLENLYKDLNTERTDDISEIELLGYKFKVPYLNGGLFEPDAADKTSFPLLAEYMERMLNFFSQYNFTIDENDPNDAEVGVDPEMLGRIFENLLEDNKDKGAFYTPKEIVQYMCRESLIAYLQTDQNEEYKESIRQFVTTHNAEILGRIKEDIDKKLQDVKICDPAIGSGAFPMGLLKELYLCRSAIESIHEDKASEIKKHIIQHNIYGVDIEKGAVDIARLRFWLSLIVDEKTPHALPNLDFKIMQGNSLLEQYKGVDLSTMTEKKYDNKGGLNWIDNILDANREELRNMLSEYYMCTDHKEKKTLRKKITDNVKQQLLEQGINIKFGDLDLAGNDQFFLWHTWFYDVFSQGGFDIVIGNPPYGAKLSKDEKKYCKKKYRVTQTNTNLKGSSDTFCVFIESGLLDLKIDGILSYIVPMSVTSSDAMGQLHELLNHSCENMYVSSYSNRPKQIFESAGLRVSIILFRRTDTDMRNLYTTRLIRRRRTDSLSYLLDNLEFENTINYRIPGRYAKVGSQMELRILNKLFKAEKKLGEFENPSGSPIFYRTAGGRYFNVITDYTTHTSAEKSINVKYVKQIGLCLSSTMFWFYQQVYTDGLNLKSTEIKSFPLPDFEKLDKEKLEEMAELYQSYLADIEEKANVRKSSGQSSYNVDTFKEYKIVRSLEKINKIDTLVCSLYNLDKEEAEFLKGYEMELRRSGE